jgi:hypothetical protein
MNHPLYTVPEQVISPVDDVVTAHGVSELWFRSVPQLADVEE